MRGKKGVLLSVGAVVAVVVAFGLYWFQPWKLLTSKSVNETVPDVVSTRSAAPTGSITPAGPQLVAGGTLISHEHTTSGTVQLVRLADGTMQLVLRDLATSDGPDLRVWLADQPVIEGRAGWHVFDDGKYLELGRLKGTHGTQSYALPAGAKSEDWKSVTIWCKRFAVSFGAAELKIA